MIELGLATGFSALQRAENSSIGAVQQRRRSRSGFSALQRAENSSIEWVERCVLYRTGFSALQRAENSSMLHQTDRRQLDNVFQCSSASRKFLNVPR